MSDPFEVGKPKLTPVDQIILTFGQYKDEFIVEIEDEKYLEWLSEQDWFAEKHPDQLRAVMWQLAEMDKYSRDDQYDDEYEHFDPFDIK